MNQEMMKTCIQAAAKITASLKEDSRYAAASNFDYILQEIIRSIQKEMEKNPVFLVV